MRKLYTEFLDSFSVAPLVKGKSEIEIIDTYLQGKTFLEKKGSSLTTEIKQRYKNILQSMLTYLPADLQQSLHINKVGGY